MFVASFLWIHCIFNFKKNKTIFLSFWTHFILACSKAFSFFLFFFSLCDLRSSWTGPWRFNGHTVRVKSLWTTLALYYNAFATLCSNLLRSFGRSHFSWSALCAMRDDNLILHLPSRRWNLRAVNHWFFYGYARYRLPLQEHGRLCTVPTRVAGNGVELDHTDVGAAGPRA